MKNIVIVGGSHSGFSCAWMMLNGPATYKNNTSVISKYNEEFPGAQQKSMTGCNSCCTCNSNSEKAAP